MLADNSVEFRDYYMRYRDGLPLVLVGVTCKIEHNERIGIVGRTGSGKSSLASALLRLVPAAGGSIIIGGVNAERIPLTQLRAMAAVVPQVDSPLLLVAPGGALFGSCCALLLVGVPMCFVDSPLFVVAPLLAPRCLLLRPCWLPAVCCCALVGSPLFVVAHLLAVSLCSAFHSIRCLWRSCRRILSCLRDRWPSTSTHLARSRPSSSWRCWRRWGC